jgi:hypothetical protein
MKLRRFARHAEPADMVCSTCNVQAREIWIISQTDRCYPVPLHAISRAMVGIILKREHVRGKYSRDYTVALLASS